MRIVKYLFLKMDKLLLIWEMMNEVSIYISSYPKENIKKVLLLTTIY